MDIKTALNTQAGRPDAPDAGGCVPRALKRTALLFAAATPTPEPGVVDEIKTGIEEGLKASNQLWSYMKGSIDWLAENYPLLIWQLIQIALVIFASLLVLRITKLVSRRMSKNRKGTDAQNKRMATYGTLFQSVMTYVVAIVAVWTVLSLLGFGQSVSAAVAAASIGGVAIGFGAQNLVRDITTGIFILFENQYAVGDYIKTNEAEGIVESAGVRVTYLRSLRGDRIIIPNGTIERVINYTRGGYVASVEVGTSYESDTRMVMNIIDSAVQTYANAHRELIVDRPTVLGIDRFEDSSVVIKVVCKSQPMKQWEVERGMRLAIKEAFDASGVEFPYPHMTVNEAQKQQRQSAPKWQGYPQPDQYAQPPQQGQPAQYAQGGPGYIKPVWQKEDFDL